MHVRKSCFDESILVSGEVLDFFAMGNMLSTSLASK